MKKLRCFIVIMILLLPITAVSQDFKDIPEEWGPIEGMPGSVEAEKFNDLMTELADDLADLHTINNRLGSYDYWVVSESESEEVSRLLKRALEKIRVIKEKCKDSPVKVEGFTIGFPLGISIDFSIEFPSE